MIIATPAICVCHLDPHSVGQNSVSTTHQDLRAGWKCTLIIYSYVPRERGKAENGKKFLPQTLTNERLNICC